jgi:hypothetical protein
MAVFIFGSDEDTVETAAAIAAFATRTAIPTAMTGMLTPIPHTPLRERLREEGRLREAEFSGNNTTDTVRFTPKRMSAAEMQRGYLQLLDQLFAPGATFGRSRMLLERLEPHIFHGRNARPGDLRAALRSLWLQGVLGGARGDYFRLLGKAWRRDALETRSARRAFLELERRPSPAPAGGRAATADTREELQSLVDWARDAAIRADRSRSLAEIDAWARAARAHAAAGAVSGEERAAIYHWSREFFRRREQLHRFPGARLVKAFNLAIKGLHCETVMHGLARAGVSGERHLG